jgi:hypothetical protein
MPILPSEVVNRYIENAQAVAESKTERLAVNFALRVNAPPFSLGLIEPPRHIMYRRARNPRTAGGPKERSKTEKEFQTWVDSVLAEIHAALCKRSARYKKEVSVLRHSGDVIIISIAAAVANKLGVNIVIVASLVAALLRMALKMGASVFCKRFESGLL